MQVYEKRPSGLGRELGEHIRRDPGAARFAAARAAAGIVLIGCLGFPLGWLWLAIGVVLLASVFVFVRAAAEAAIRRPALVLTGTPKWDGTRRTSWTVVADDPLVTALALADAIDRELGAALTAIDEGDEYRGVTRTEAFAAPTPSPGTPARPAMIAWGVDGRPRLKATGDVAGVWMRLAPSDGIEPLPVVTLLANEGEARRRLAEVAWRV